jgi:two-component system, cell cycle sensor histidine kinase and response regulator CckA
MQQKINVLLIEDNPVDARLIEGMLERDDTGIFALKHVSTLAEGMHSLTATSGNHLILLDLGLPDATGLQTLRRIMPLARDASVVVITGTSDEETGIAALREGAHDYLIKGQVRGEQLRRVLRYALERHKIQSELCAEAERRRLSEQRYHLLAETAPMGILLTDSLGKVIDANTAALRMFGYAREELIGASIDILLPERLRSSHHEHRSDYMKKPSVRHVGIGMDLLACTKDGTEFPVEVALGPLVTEDGKALVSSSIVDITARKKMEARLHLSQRMEVIGKLAGGVAHDFNNLLGVILGSADAALEKLPPEHPVRAKLEVITQAGSSAADLTRQLLAFSRRQMLQARVVNLKEVIERTEVLLRRLIGPNIRFTTSLEPSLGQVKVDPGQIEHVLINLVVNARDAMPQGGRLTIEARNVELDDSYQRVHLPVIPGQYTMISVEDSGCGMNRETQARIFDPFFTTKELGKGTGLGLATVYGIVKQSGGYIWVYSEPDKGTIFKVYLRRVDQSPQPAKPDASDATALRGSETILLAEDSESLREMAREYLESVGYTVLDAVSGKAALQRANDFAGTIHLLLTDIVMPEMSGPELAVQLKALRPEIKVIFTSGYSDTSIVQKDVLDSAAAFIQKPYRPKALAQRIREVLEGSAPNPPNPAQFVP